VVQTPEKRIDGSVDIIINVERHGAGDDEDGGKSVVGLCGVVDGCRLMGRG